MKWCLLFFASLLVLACNGNLHAAKSSEPAGRTMMAVFAHSDDELMVSPVLSKYAKLGVKIYLVIATDGSQGVTAHANIPPGDSLAKVRAKEALCTAATLGINPPILLGYDDGKLASIDNLISLHEKIDSLFNEIRPDVVITFGPDGSYGHPDHRLVGDVVTEVFQQERAEPLKQLLYIGFPKEVLSPALPIKTESVNWYKKHLLTTQKKLLTYRIPYAEDDLKIGRNALGCCKSQFTEEMMDEIFILMAQTKGLIYFRPWLGSAAIRNDIFE